MHVANQYKRIVSDLHPSVHAAHVDLIGLAFNRVHSAQLPKCLIRKYRSDIANLRVFTEKFAAFEAQFTGADGACFFDDSDVARWRTSLVDAAKTQRDHIRSAYDDWVDYDRLAALQWRVKGMAAHIAHAGTADAPLEGRLHLPILKYLCKLPKLKFEDFDAKTQGAFRKTMTKAALDATVLASRLCAGEPDQASYEANLKAADDALPLKMLDQLSPLLQAAHLEVKTARAACSHRAGEKKEAARARRAKKKHILLFKELLNINNAWVARENTLRGVIDAKATLPSGYAYLEIATHLDPGFNGSFPRGRAEPCADDPTTVPFTSRQPIVYVADRIDRLFEDLIVTTLQAKNLKYVLTYRGEHLSCLLQDSLTDCSLWGRAVHVQHELHRNQAMLQDLAAFRDLSLPEAALGGRADSDESDVGDS